MSFTADTPEEMAALEEFMLAVVELLDHLADRRNGPVLKLKVDRLQAAADSVWFANMPCSRTFQ